MDIYDLIELFMQFCISFSHLVIDNINFVINLVITIILKIWISVLDGICMILPLLIAVAYLTLLERRVMASMQRRRGPNVVGIFGLLQAFADGLKLFVKENVFPTNADMKLFIAAPILTFTLSLITWAVVPFGENMVFADLNLGILYLLAVSSLGVYGILVAGWSSNSKYAFLGGLRSAAQMVSYEVSMGLIFCTVLLMAGSLNLSVIVEAQDEMWYCAPLLPLFIIFFISTLAETNRSPFDLPEGESELVAGFFVEYSGVGFVLFYLGEYTNMLFMSGMSVILFLGGWLPPYSFDSIEEGTSSILGEFLFYLFWWIPGPVWFGLKLTAIVFTFVWVRAAFPRFRYDQLMSLGWKVFLPFTLAYFIFIAGVLIAFDWLPPGL